MTEYALYLDVAGHPANQEILCAAGFLSTESKWLAFEPAWKEALKRNGLPEVFHMTDFERKYKNDPRHWEILKDLINVIADYAVASFSNSLSMSGYRHINDLFPLEEMFGKPYGVSARCAARLAYHWLGARGVREPMLVFVEKGTLHEGDMVECFRRDGLEDPISVPKFLPPVQAADIYAWERAYYSRTSIRRPSMIHFKQMMPDFTRGVDGKWGKKDLKDALEKMHTVRRNQMHPDATIVFNNSPKRIRKRTIK